MASPEETRVKNLESELSLLKNQVQQTLLDIREHVLEFTNPFTAEGRLVRAWQERTAQAAQTNLGGEADLESLLETDDGAKDESAGAVTATAPPPAPIDDDDWDEFEDEEPMDVAPQAAADSSDDLEVNLEPEEYESEPCPGRDPSRSWPTGCSSSARPTGLRSGRRSSKSSFG